MSPKGILITFAVVSLLLIGIMFLAVDGRNNPVLDDHTITKIIEQGKEREKEFLDSLKSAVSSQEPKKFTFDEAFNNSTENLLTHIKSLQETLFPGGLAAHDLGESPKITENNAVFFKQNGEYTKQATQFIAKLDAFENTIRALQKTFPKLNSIKAEVREEYTGGLDWLDYNYRDFPAVASHAKLSLLKEAIKNKQEAVITVLLRK